MNKFKMVAVTGMVLLASLACSLINLGRNNDGTFTLETTLPLQVIQTTLETAANFTDIEDLQLELRDGYIDVSAASVEYQGVIVRNVSFHLELYAVNGQLAAEITNARVNGEVFDDGLFEQVNAMIAQQLTDVSGQSDRAELVDVSISPDGVKMTWQVDPSLGE